MTSKLKKVHSQASIINVKLISFGMLVTQPFNIKILVIYTSTFCAFPDSPRVARKSGPRSTNSAVALAKLKVVVQGRQ